METTLFQNGPMMATDSEYPRVPSDLINARMTDLEETAHLGSLPLTIYWSDSNTVIQSFISLNTNCLSTRLIWDVFQNPYSFCAAFSLFSAWTVTDAMPIPGLFRILYFGEIHLDEITILSVSGSELRSSRLSTIFRYQGVVAYYLIYTHNNWIVKFIFMSCPEPPAIA